MRKIYLKSRYKSLYLQVEEYDGHDCGISLQMQIDSNYYNLRVSFNEIADKLSKIDPDCPTFRYKTS